MHFHVSWHLRWSASDGQCGFRKSKAVRSHMTAYYLQRKLEMDPRNLAVAVVECDYHLCEVAV